MQHAVGDFVDGSIAACGNDQIASGIEGLTRLKRRAAGSGGGNEIRFNALGCASAAVVR